VISTGLLHAPVEVADLPFFDDSLARSGGFVLLRWWFGGGVRRGGFGFLLLQFRGGGDVALAVCYGSGGDECDGTEMDLSWIAVAKMALMGVVVVVVVWVVSVVWW
jgi:hypothetical protein